MIHYSIRESTRAKHVRLQVRAGEGLVVVVPRGFDHNAIPSIVQEKQSWIEKALRDVATQSKTAAQSWTLPERITLRAIEEEWRVIYHPAPTSWCTATLKDSRLEIRGSIGDRGAVQAALLRWLHRKTHTHLIPRLQGISAETGLRYNRARVANQRSRWGSYSSRGTISINQKLLFLPPHLVRYVFLHELCHSIQPNHSPRFWALLRKYEPNATTWRKELRAAEKYIPAWTKPDKAESDSDM
jgi:hypothetical protein